MALWINKLSYLLVVLIFCLKSVKSSEYVPVYTWETSNNYSPFPALERKNEKIFQDILLDKLNKNTCVLVFLEESLSPEDFISHDQSGNGVFQKLSDIKNNVSKTEYTFMEAPLSTFKSLPGFRVSMISLDKVPDSIKVKPKEILIIDMNDAKDNESRREMLFRHDSNISNIYKYVISKCNNVAAFLTGRHSSWVLPSEISTENRQKRDVSGVDDEKIEGLFKSTNIMMYAGNNSYLEYNNNKYFLSSFNVDNKSSSNTSLVIYSDSVVIQFSLNISESGYWHVEEITGHNGMGEFNFTIKDMYAPERFSYHCNNTKLMTENATLVLPKFQIQWKSQPIQSFGDAYDCVGFTSAPIWSGLFVTFILVAIMTFGLTMIMDIKTMDRFDDPKGKTISINVSE